MSPAVGEPVGLLLREHAERAARFHAEPAHDTHHVEHAIELVAVRYVAPGRAHAEADGALLPRARRGVGQLVEGDEVLAA